MILRVTTHNEAEGDLAGGLSCQWSSSDDSVVRFLTDLDDNRITVDAVAAGEADASVKLGDMTFVLPVTVTGGGGGGGGAGGAPGGNGGTGGGGG